MRLKLTFLILLITFMIGRAQVATDFTIFTTHGDSLTLYEDLLDQGKTVVIDIFFTTCPPCNSIAPLLEPLYQDWGGGDYDVEFIALSNWSNDSNSDVLNYEIYHGHTYSGAGSDGGSLMAVAPYINGTYGTFLGTPTFVVIAPDGSINYDVRGFSNQNTIEEIDAAIAATGAQPPNDPQPFEFPGRIQTFFGQDVSGVKVDLVDCDNVNDPNAPTLTDDITNGTGRFVIELDQLPAMESCVRPFNNDFPNNGVSTFDILLLRKHLLSIELLPTPLAINSGDINRNGSVSTIDLVYIRQVILGIIPNFPNNSSWRFVPVNTTVIDPDNTDPYNFTAFKVGDLNGDFDPTMITNGSIRTTTSLTLRTGLPVSDYDGTLLVPIHTPSVLDIAGIQGTFQMTGDELKLTGIRGAQLDIRNNIHTFLNEGKLTFSWDAIPSIEVNRNLPLFYLEVEPKNGLDTESITDLITLSNAPTPAQLIDATNNVHALSLEELDQSSVNLLVSPNPVHDEMNITIQAGEGGEYVVGLYHANGQLINSRTEQLIENQSQTIQWPNLPDEKGLYLIIAEGPGGIFVEKVIMH